MPEKWQPTADICPERSDSPLFPLHSDGLSERLEIFVRALRRFLPSAQTFLSERSDLYVRTCASKNRFNI